MKNEKLLVLIKGGETQETEFKESIHSGQELSKIICAFANTDGGYLFIGVAKSGKIKGLKGDLDKLQQDIANAGQNVFSPPIISTAVHEADNKMLITVKINKANDKNAHTFGGVVYVRIGSTIRKLEGQSLFDFLKNRQILCFDEGDCEAKIDDLDTAKIRSYMEKRNLPQYLKTYGAKEFLLSNMLAKMNGDLKIKNVASLFFAKDPCKWHPQSEVRAVHFSGTEPVGVIAQQDFKSDPIENIEQAISFIRKNISKRFIIPEDSARRIEIEEYPLPVVREAIVNAVAHRDYHSYDSIQINMFNDRIEISNPGSLPEGLTKEFFGKRSVRRNPLTYRLLRDCRYVEGLGTGIPIMINEMRKAGLRDPEFHFEGGFFIVVLKNIKSSLMPIEGIKDLNERQLNAIQYLQKNKSIKSKTYANINNISLPTALDDISEMIKFGYLKKVGSYRGAYYVLNEKKFK